MYFLKKILSLSTEILLSICVSSIHFLDERNVNINIVFEMLKRINDIKIFHPLCNGIICIPGNRVNSGFATWAEKAWTRVFVRERGHA